MRAERDRLERPGRPWLKTHLVVLLTPGGQLAVHHDLALQDTGHSAIDRPGRPPPQLLLRPPEWLRPPRHVAQDRECPGHRTVVEGNTALISAGIRIPLRPAPVLVLRLEEILDSRLATMPEPWQAGLQVDSPQVPDLGVRGAIVEGRIPAASREQINEAFRPARRSVHLFSLRKAPVRSLPRENRVTPEERLLLIRSEPRPVRDDHQLRRVDRRFPLVG